ncbi:YDG/SRA domain-containing protein [Cryobacterium tagatosivorans]|uniref:HNH endonuclease n=1 Tax=Cryobacterium tagatosivorans TaxID=1259199 RepID=A0A4R8UCT3_9MICO|nr:YDG/SRA domain-containing protein [Cryobacterium tagatosivorans]TFB46981.1 HNH endonuclease [Cryobacterium tagatosivorans]
MLLDSLAAGDYMGKFFGTPDGVRVGQLFVDRRELSDAFVHRPRQAGIHGTKADGADSIVLSGGYDDQDSGDYIIYTGHGGRAPNSSRHIKDQSPDAPGNAGLITSLAQALPVRVIRGKHKESPFAPPAGYLYSGLYLVTQWWMDEGRDGFQIVQFRLERIDEQTPLEPQSLNIPDPEFADTIVSRRIRDSQLAREVKHLYDFQCQICDITVPTGSGSPYAEGAHVRALGRPHLGRDDLSNILCLCPNHHTQFDFGGMVISDQMVAMETRTMTPVAALTFRKRHFIDVANARYHRLQWARASEVSTGGDPLLASA